MMHDLIHAFPEHIQESIRIFHRTGFTPPAQPILNVVISGLGGSGIGGTIMADLARPYAPVPVTVIKDYHIPAFTGPNTLFIASSYSGGTEETLEALSGAEAKGAQIICITSGGKLAEIATERKYQLYQIPGGNPPRAAFGYSFAQLVCIFTSYGLLPATFEKALTAAAQWLASVSSEMETTSMELATRLSGKLPVIYVEAGMEGVAVRFRQQLNENAKMLAWHGVVPEMNHNELVGWREKTDKLAVVYLRSNADYKRNAKRMDINKEIIRNYTENISELYAQGDHPLEKIIYLIHYCDWVSYHLAGLRDIDIMDIQVIDYLKTELSRLD